MPALVRLYLVNIAYGLVLALLFTAALIALDVAHLRHLVTTVSGGWLAVLMLVVFNTIVFASVQFGIAVMRMAETPPPPDRGRRAPAHRIGAQPLRALVGVGPSRKRG